MPSGSHTRGARGVLALLAAAVAVLVGHDVAVAADRPNIVLIVADDLGFAELGCQGCPDVPTPHLDRLAAQGVRCTQAYVVAPVCSPSRAGLVTGRYPQRFGYEFNTPQPDENAPEIGLPLDQHTLADRLREAGYRTGAIGKWHLGLDAVYHPLARGFDESFGFQREGHFYFRRGDPRARSLLRPDEPAYNLANPLLRGTALVEETEYLTEAFTREAVAFIERHRGEPFFLYLSYNAVHHPLEAPAEYVERFAAIGDPKRRIFAGMLAALDDGVGRVLAALEERDLARSTLVVFLSDNGGPTAALTSSNLPFRGSKGDVYEGGIRVPYLMRWPGVLPEGSVYDRPASSLDVVPTVLAAAGVSPGDDAALDGVDLRPHLAGEAMPSPRERLFWRYGERRAVRMGSWKLVVGMSPDIELYDLEQDPSETRNIAASNPQRVAMLQQTLAEWEETLLPPRWPKPRR